jgi:hypothetical protein
MLSSSIGAWLSGAAGSRWGTHRLLWTVAPLAAIVLLAGAAGTAILLPLFVLPTGCWSILNPHVADYLSRRTPAGERATILSLMNLAPGVLSIGVTLALAPLIDATGLRGTLAAASLVLLALILGALTLWSRADRAASPVR